MMSGLSVKEFVKKHKGHKVRVIHAPTYNNHLLGEVGYVKEPNIYEVWVSFDLSMDPSNTYSFNLDQLELVSDKVGSLPLPG